MSKRKNKGGGGGRSKRRRGGKAECDLGADCPYRHEQQHQSEFWHADVAETAQRKREAQRKASFKHPGQKLGQGGRGAGAFSVRSITHPPRT
jgi:hypothetical protein